jgi:glycopeptide antibiotics resistance protein
MAIFNLYSVSHLFIWLAAGRYTSINWVAFLMLSIGWEFLELVLPFEFAAETVDNKIGDVIVNILGFSIGRRLRPSDPS